MTIKKTLKILIVTLTVFFTIFILDSFIGFFSEVTGVKSLTMRMNDRAAENIADYLAELPMPNGCEVVEKIYLSGHIKESERYPFYYGGVLIKSDKTEEELKEYFKQFPPYDEYLCSVTRQETQNLEEVHAASRLDRDYFLTDVSDGDYYLLHSISENGIPPFEILFDMR